MSGVMETVQAFLPNDSLTSAKGSIRPFGIGTALAFPIATLRMCSGLETVVVVASQEPSSQTHRTGRSAGLSHAFPLRNRICLHIAAMRVNELR